MFYAEVLDALKPLLLENFHIFQQIYQLIDLNKSMTSMVGFLRTRVNWEWIFDKNKL